ncbi:MAG: hypothetical protein C4520_00820 [Candidatus Abyssobacteria bacterium SURF_5]|jgi:predicted  nucleic acid-binding Zn-ribbon protein|uniref:C4-type zinc ribbon domain-containing protein n=1 Tax=Abyssobacteria bacterium (strain SURF_5) TaxID=2093360 RepID=A0A3A4P0M7_ABYX5|nr:MAG: hypothetical protein C4520_00820 [Candidatus Abyssubacteria bacterium SURF_5]
MKESAQIRLLLKLYELETDGEAIDRAAVLEEIRENLDPSIFRRYLKVKERKGSGVAILRDGMCSGCNMIYPDTHEVFRHDGFIHTCEFCGRFLILDKDAA